MPNTATDPADALLAAWSARAADLVRRRLRDARAHAEAARMSDAEDRLVELGADLVHEVLRPARSEFHRDGFTAALSDADPRVVDTTIRPTAESDRAAQTAPIAGRDQAKDIEAAVVEACSRLRLSANAEPFRGWHAGWELHHRAVLAGRIRSSLSDAQIALREAISQIVIKPEFR
jgi:hypothetical protein